MAVELEYERTFLLRQLPEELDKARHMTIRDVYIPESSAHAQIRVRRQGDEMMITKKHQQTVGDSTVMVEHTIPLSELEYDTLAACSTKDFVKTRYFMTIDGHDSQVDVYGGKLAGLAMVDFEFASEDELRNFTMPDICLADVSQQEFIAAGYLAGKSYDDIAERLGAFGYQKIV